MIDTNKVKMQNNLLNRLLSEAIALYENPNFDDERNLKLSEYVEVLEPFITKGSAETLKMRSEHYALNKFYQSKDYRDNPDQGLWEINF